MSKPLVVIGSGGHASILVDILLQKNASIIGVISPEKQIEKKIFTGIKNYKHDDDILDFNKNKVLLVNGIGMLPHSNLISRVYNRFTEMGCQFASVIADSTIISSFSKLSAGVQMFPGAIMNAGASIGENTIINSGAIVEHDCQIGKNNHIAPGVTLSGQVTSGSNVHFGTGASVIQNISIGNNVIIGAGSTITKDVQDDQICFPTRTIEKARLIDES